MNHLSKRLIVLSLVLAGAGGIVIAEAFLIESPRPEVSTSGRAAIGGPFTLVATDGKTVTDQTYRGKWLLIYFGYTFCPDACPTALSNMSVALEKLGSDANKLQAVFITVDPQRDIGEVMADYLKSFDSRIVGLTGSQAQIDSVVKEYRMYVAQQRTGGVDYLVDHSAYFYLMNPEGAFVSVLGGELSGEEIVDQLRIQWRSNG
jgi:protein SCO1